jgi:glycosyltransferase involved in cell wall biosynthesis
MARKGHKVLIFTSSPKKKSEVDLGKNIFIIRYKPINIIKYPDFHMAVPNPTILGKIIKFKPDIIHSHMPTFLGWQAVFCSKIFDIPVIGTYHTLLNDFLGYFPIVCKFSRTKLMQEVTWEYTRRYYNSCDIVTTPSVAMKHELVKHGINHIISISNGVDLNKFHPRNIKKDGKTLLYIGRVGYEKNVDIVIKAFKLLLKKMPDAILVIAGSGPDIKKLKAISSDTKSIKFLGPINHEDLPNVYSMADVFVTASTIETEGLVILEAMACGLPIIGVNMLAVPHIVKHGKNGFVAHPYDKKEIASYMEILLKNKELREKFGRNSLEIVKKFSLEKTIDQMEKVYKLLIQKNE